MPIINDHAEFVVTDPPKLMRINGDFIDEVHARDFERMKHEQEQLPTCAECGKKFEPKEKRQAYCSRICACRANARKAQMARRMKRQEVGA